MMTKLAICAAVLLINVYVSRSSWTQQYGDGSSSSFIPFQGTMDTKWIYTSQKDSQDASRPLNPATTEDGTVFLPLRLRLIAISSKGYVLREYIAQQPSARYYLQMNNALYSKKYKAVFAVGSGSTQSTQGEEVGLVSAFDPTDNRIIWSNANIRYPSAHPLALSETNGLLYVIGNGNVVALSLDTGSIVWSKSISSSNWPIPIKVSKLPARDDEILLLPVVPSVNDGVLYALDAATGKQLWQQTLGFNYDGSFAVSQTGIIYGCTGLFPDIAHGKQIVILEAKTGDILYNGKDYCSNSSQALTPSADSNGYGYYSCGNQVFSVTSNGNLRWRSDIYGTQELPPHLPVSIDPDGTIFYVTINQTNVLALSSQDGSLLKSYTSRPGTIINQPPILVGNNYMYIAGREWTQATTVIYPIKR